MPWCLSSGGTWLAYKAVGIGSANPAKINSDQSGRLDVHRERSDHRLRYSGGVERLYHLRVSTFALAAPLPRGRRCRFWGFPSGPGATMCASNKLTPRGRAQTAECGRRLRSNRIPESARPFRIAVATVQLAPMSQRGSISGVQVTPPGLNSPSASALALGGDQPAACGPRWVSVCPASSEPPRSTTDGFLSPDAR